MTSKIGSVIPHNYNEVSKSEFKNLNFDTIGIRSLEEFYFGKKFMLYKEYKGTGHYILTNDKELAKRYTFGNLL